MAKEAQQYQIDYLEQLYNELGTDIMRFLTRKVGPAAATDLFQDTFVQALIHFDRLDKVNSPKAWLMKVAYNLSCNFYRQKNIYHIELTEDFIPLETISEDLRMDRIRDVIESLPEKNKEVIMLKWYDQLSYEEISHILDIPIGTVRSRLHNSMNKIRQILNHSETEVQ